MANPKRRKKLRRGQKRRGLLERQRGDGLSPRQDDQAPSQSDWEGPSGSIGTYIAEESSKTLHAYRSQPNLVDEHANHEEDTARGGYAHRQLFELVQNGADALAGSSGGRIWLGLNSAYLYCADEGRAIDPDGVTALMFSHLSPKRGTTEIGRFGFRVQVGPRRHRRARVLQPLRFVPLRSGESRWTDSTHRSGRQTLPGPAHTGVR